MGKSSLIKVVQDRCPGVFGFSVSHTTRAPRAGEQNGRDYHFVSNDEFQAGLQNGDFIEYAEVGDQLVDLSSRSLADHWMCAIGAW